MPSFDIFSKVDMQEVDNAVNQAMKELAQRYDFRGTDTKLSVGEDKKSIVIASNGEDKIEAATEVLRLKLVKRGVPLAAVEFQKPEATGGMRLRQVAKLQEGIPTEKAKEIVKLVKESKLKVQASIQGEELRITGKSRDDLQSAMQLVRGHDFGADLQFGNFRD
ncbi:MAG: YajQ family cyclic di-GMP-binding protein [Deltaproteobacteria bacterium]